MILDDLTIILSETNEMLSYLDPTDKAEGELARKLTEIGDAANRISFTVSGTRLNFHKVQDA